MRIAILHLSDFHIHDRDRILSQKINGILSSLNVLEKIDDYNTGDGSLCWLNSTRKLNISRKTSKSQWKQVHFLDPLSRLFFHQYKRH